MKHVLVVFNVSAGRKKALKFKKPVIKFLLKNSDFFKVISAPELKTVDISGFDTIVVAGGDGTINSVLPLIVNTDVKLGVIPVGTADLLASKFEITQKNALEVIKNGKTTKIDSCTLNGKNFVLRAGLGFDDDIIRKTPQSLKNRFGYFAYFVAGILFALRLKKRRYAITTDEENFFEDASCVIVANSANMYKNTVSVASNSDPTDGLFDIFVLKTANPIIFFFEFLKIIFNIKQTGRFAVFSKSKSVKIEGNFFPLHVDGETQKIRENLDFEILPRSINIFTP